MLYFSKLNQIPPQNSLEGIHLQKLMDMDVAFQARLKALEKMLPHLLNTRMKGGSGLQMANLIRSYFFEYFDRYFKLGMGSFPSSFNVVESFLRFDHTYTFFDLRDEVDHLLSIDDYFSWYEKNEIPKNTSILEAIMPEGITHSYDFISDSSSPYLSGDSQQVFAGVSIIRHDYELSCILLAGEKPPQTPDDEVAKMVTEQFASNQKGLTPSPNWKARDRYLDTFPDFAKVIVLTRFDLRTAKHDVRYVNLDLGPSFTVFTDDPSVFGEMPEREKQKLRQVAISGLPRYNNLFSAFSTMIYLPAFFAAFPDRNQNLRMSSALGAMRDDKRVKETVSVLGQSQCPMERNIRCFPVAWESNASTPQRIDPPELSFKSDGFWKTIAPHEVGEGRRGEKLFGRTWVSRHESWSAQSPQSFMLERHIQKPLGPDPGIVYIQRSPALEPDLYKVGLTRREPEIRAQELSAASGVPLPFGILAKWSVGDCSSVEREIHHRLEAFRINPRREFFKAELSFITQTIEDVIRSSSRKSETQES